MENVQKKFTVVKLKHPQGGHVWMFHDPIGMLVGSVAGNGAKFGEDPNIAVMRSFLDDEHAMEWVKGQCRARYAADVDVIFEETDAEKRIELVMPGDVGRLRN